MYQENDAPRGQPRGSYSGGVRANRRIVGLLGLPGDDAVLDIDLPRARAGAVHAVGRPHLLVVAPALVPELLGLPAPLAEQAAAVIGLHTGEEVLTRRISRSAGVSVIHDLRLSRYDDPCGQA